MRPDGSDRTRLTRNGSLGPVSWSPESSLLLFSALQLGIGALDVYRMNADGCELVRRTLHPASDDLPCWLPLS